MSKKKTTRTKKRYLTKLRERKGISVRELARQLNTSPTNVSYWERSGRPPKSDLLLQMAEILGCSLEELLGVRKRKK